MNFAVKVSEKEIDIWEANSKGKIKMEIRI